VTLRNSPQESRKELFLWLFERAGTQNKNNTRFQFWQQNNQPIELGTDEKVYKISDYIHENPVKAGIVCSPEDYLYSSAMNYANMPEKLIDVILI
jgi:putative transposase